MSIVSINTEKLLQVVSGHIEEVAPYYERPQADVVKAIETGVGNCLAKAVIAAIVFEHLTQEGLAAVFYNRQVHPSTYADIIGRAQKGFGHAAMLAQTDSGIWTLGFNINNTQAQDRYVVPANDSEEERIGFADGKIIAVGPQAADLMVGSWYDTYRSYMEDVSIQDSSAHTVEEENLRELVLHRLLNPPSGPTEQSLSAA